MQWAPLATPRGQQGPMSAHTPWAQTDRPLSARGGASAPPPAAGAEVRAKSRLGVAVMLRAPDVLSSAHVWTLFFEARLWVLPC